MTHIETSRVNEVLGLQIGKIQECAHELNVGIELQELETRIGALEEAISSLKNLLRAVPHDPA